MANLIDISYFVNNITIPQATDAGIVAEVNSLINELEPKVLTDLLGYELYKAFLAGIAVLPTPDAKWTDLRDGKEYTNRYGRLTKYRGLRYTENTVPKSLIANYVYWHFMEKNDTNTTGSGEKKTDNVNSVQATPVSKMTRAWNEMVSMNHELVEFLLTNIDIYTEFQSQYGYIPRDLVKKQNPFGI